MSHAGNPHELDVLGVGAVNVDLIVTDCAEGEPGDIEDVELLTTSDVIRRELAVGGCSYRAFHGGSTFNCLLMLAQLKLDIRIGFAGMDCGASHDLDASHLERLERFGVETISLPRVVAPGVCSSLPGQRGRKLLTAPEGNLRLPMLLEDPALLDAVARTKVLHLTSLLEDPKSPDDTAVIEAAARFVQRATERNPSLLFSFDPGHQWTPSRLESEGSLASLYRRADLLFLNDREYEALTGANVSSTADRQPSLQWLCPRGTVLIYKGRRELVVQQTNGLVVERVPQTNYVERPIDATGAGDAVAAGVLAAVADGHTLIEGSVLGLRLAAIRVAGYGDTAHRNLLDALGPVWSQTVPMPVPAHVSAVQSHAPAPITFAPTTLIQVNTALQIDLHRERGDLARELGVLRDSLPHDHPDRSLVDLTRVAAEAEDTGKVVALLTALGRRGLAIAEHLAVPVLTAALKRVLGLA